MLPNVPNQPEITKLLHRWKQGDREALASLASLAYDDLHAIAALSCGGRAPSTPCKPPGCVPTSPENDERWPGTKQVSRPN
jgi:hypothetical protein